jgi:hypothetical protein
MPADRSRECPVSVVIDQGRLMSALRYMTVNNPEFRHRAWSAWDAEVLESAARMIRSGYSAEADLRAVESADRCPIEPPKLD